jgi:hypothetical protein
MGFDLLPLSLSAQVAFQATLKPWYDRGYIPKALYMNGRNKTGSEVMADARRVVMNDPFSEWGPGLDKANADAADFMINFANIATVSVTFAIPPALKDVALRLLRIMSDLFGFCNRGEKCNRFDEEIAPLASASYEAQKKEAVSLSLRERYEFSTRALGVLVHFLWAFFWQEEFLDIPGVSDIIQLQETNFLAGLLMRPINGILNSFQGPYGSLVTEALPQFQTHTDEVYPGATKCSRSFSAHAKWHEISANALTRFWLLGVDLQRLMTKEGLLSGPTASMYESIVSTVTNIAHDEDSL